MTYKFEFKPTQDLKAKAIVVEDQPVLWGYIQSCLEEFYEIQAFCSSTEEAELAFKKYKPDLVWLDCYLGEIADSFQGLKNSGLELASWIKNHSFKTKIFLFTASNEMSILKHAQKLGIEGIALGGKFIEDKKVIIDGIRAVNFGLTWTSPNMIENVELEELYKITVFEFCVASSLLLGKGTSQIAEELDTTRKQINNAIYRIKEKLELDTNISRADFLEFLRDKLKDSFEVNQYYNLSEIISINSLVESCLSPVLEKLKSGDFAKAKLRDFVPFWDRPSM